jgi:deazaflavin-dependent oxidoreductase (nitroreductase family)
MQQYELTVAVAWERITALRREADQARSAKRTDPAVDQIGGSTWSPSSTTPGRRPAQMKAKDVVHRVSTRIHRAVFKASKGRLLGRIVGLPVVELISTGRRSGKQRSTMLAAPIVEDDRLVLVASFGGDDRDPAWYRNLNANPQVRVTTAGVTRAMIARTATDQERAQLWPQITARYQGYARYQERTKRPIPVVILQPK